jgi:hypothetical protein
MSIVNILYNINSNDNSVRAQSESDLQVLQSIDNGTSYPFLLLNLFDADNVESHILQLAAVLLRRHLVGESQSSYRNMSPEV